jgi:hypothetical protein
MPGGRRQLLGMKRRIKCFPAGRVHGQPLLQHRLMSYGAGKAGRDMEGPEGSHSHTAKAQ